MDETGSVVLDTSVVVAYLRKKDFALVQYLETAENLYLPVISMGELLYGAYKSNQQEQALRGVKGFAELCHFLLPTTFTADLYGQVKAGLARRGTQIPQNDIWIAALALEHKLPLATRDAHFTNIAGLTTLNW